MSSCRAVVLALALAACGQSATSLTVDLSAADDVRPTALSLELSFAGGEHNRYALPLGGGPPELPGSFVLRVADRAMRVDAVADATLPDGRHVYGAGSVSVTPYRPARIALFLGLDMPPDLGGLDGGGSAVGQGCGSPSECSSGFCVDGVCCASACGDACAACSTTFGALVNGQCGLRSPGMVCRVA